MLWSPSSTNPQHRGDHMWSPQHAGTHTCTHTQTHTHSYAFPTCPQVNMPSFPLSLTIPFLSTPSQFYHFYYITQRSDAGVGTRHTSCTPGPLGHRQRGGEGGWDRAGEKRWDNKWLVTERIRYREVMFEFGEEQGWCVCLTHHALCCHTIFLTLIPPSMQRTKM